jgi:hypothetical protein
MYSTQTKFYKRTLKNDKVCLKAIIRQLRVLIYFLLCWFFYVYVCILCFNIIYFNILQLQLRVPPLFLAQVVRNLYTTVSNPSMNQVQPTTHLHGFCVEEVFLFFVRSSLAALIY